jgi:single-strand DNA-binding protein
MELVGRITKDAVVNQLKDERKVVNFSIAINDNYKPKGSNEVKKITTFVNCSYWINAGIAPYLIKGALIEVSGRISVSAYTDSNKEAKGSLNFHVNNIKIHGNSKVVATEKEEVLQSTEPADDLPF